MARPGVHHSTSAMPVDDEFWPTPAAGIVAFLIEERERILAHGSRIWEMACGNGVLCHWMQRFGFDVVATNLTDRGYGRTGVDFLTTRKTRAEVLITNPPFSKAADFIRHWWKLGARYLALLLPAAFFHAEPKRGPLFKELPPARILPLGFRLDFDGRGSPPMECSWFVWERTNRNPYPLYHPPLPRPQL